MSEIRRLTEWTRLVAVFLKPVELPVESLLLQ